MLNIEKLLGAGAVVVGGGCSVLKEREDKGLLGG